MAAANVSGPRIPAVRSVTAKKPKNSEDRSRGIMLANSDRDSAWLPPCTVPTRIAST